MDHHAHVDAAARELEALIAAVEAGPLDARVPTCPDYDVDALALHIGGFCTAWLHAMQHGVMYPGPPGDGSFGALTAPGPEARAAWVRDLGERFFSQLRSMSPDAPCWTWYEPDMTAAFVARRASHELAIHRVDAQLARGAADPVDAELAADGIEEVFMIQAFSSPYRVDIRHGTGQTLHLHGTDVDDRGIDAEWLVTLGPDGLVVAREHARGDLALRASVSDLEMLLYQRPTVGPVEQFGDPAVLDLFYGEFTFG